MKTPKLSALFIAVALPASILASSATDRKIEDAAKASYNYRTVLEDNVKVKSNDGVVTLTGTVRDSDDKALAADTVENLPGVVSVKNEVVVNSADPEHSDTWIALKIRSTLLTRANVSAADTQVTVKDGVVILTGKADNLAQKDLTGAYAKDIDNVKSVKNELTIVSPAVSAADTHTMGDTMDDASITSQVKYALLSHRSTSALKTKVITKDGVVSVSGEAASDAEKSLVTKLTEGVRGVKSVTNTMVVKA
jgi:hyperosmotically inducible periplasmic protein